MLASQEMRFALPVLLLAAPACRLPALERPAWDHARPGAVAVFLDGGIWNDHDAASVITFDSNFGAQEVELDTELVGELGVALGAEVHLDRDWSLRLGYEHRRFDPRNTPGFLFETITAEELFLAARWRAPAFGLHDRWRPFVEARLGYMPSMEFDAAVDLSSIGQPNPTYDFDGSPSWNAGLAAGLELQWRSDLVFSIQVRHELPLDATSDRVHLEFLPGFEVDLDTSVEPEGTIVLVGLSWYP